MGWNCQDRFVLDLCLVKVRSHRSRGTSMAVETSDQQRRDQELYIIIERCRGRLVKHATRLNSLLGFVGRGRGKAYDIPRFQSSDPIAESSQDVNNLGEYCEATHDQYMRVSLDRLKQLKILVSKKISTTSQTSDFVSLTKLAYDVRRSKSFRRLLEVNTSRSAQPGFGIVRVQDISERIGQISKYCRAAETFTVVLTKLRMLGKIIQVETVPVQKLQIHELNERTVKQVSKRVGLEFSSGGAQKIQKMLNRWEAYREHAEIQLLVFYEQSPGIEPFVKYIGCDKRSCYMCFTFLEAHGRFEVAGCHQSLYSRWTIRKDVLFENKKNATNFNRALKELSVTLQQKVDAAKNTRWQSLGYNVHNESVANLSRISLIPGTLIVLPSLPIEAVACPTGTQLPTMLRLGINGNAPLPPSFIGLPTPDTVPNGVLNDQMLPSARNPEPQLEIESRDRGPPTPLSSPPTTPLANHSTATPLPEDTVVDPDSPHAERPEPQMKEIRHRALGGRAARLFPARTSPANPRSPALLSSHAAHSLVSSLSTVLGAQAEPAKADPGPPTTDSLDASAVIVSTAPRAEAAPEPPTIEAPDLIASAPAALQISVAFSRQPSPCQPPEPTPPLSPPSPASPPQHQRTLSALQKPRSPKDRTSLPPQHDRRRHSSRDDKPSRVHKRRSSTIPAKPVSRRRRSRVEIGVGTTSWEHGNRSRRKRTSGKGRHRVEKGWWAMVTRRLRSVVERMERVWNRL